MVTSLNTGLVTSVPVHFTMNGVPAAMVLFCATLSKLSVSKPVEATKPDDSPSSVMAVAPSICPLPTVTSKGRHSVFQSPSL